MDYQLVSKWEFIPCVLDPLIIFALQHCSEAIFVTTVANYHSKYYSSRKSRFHSLKGELRWTWRVVIRPAKCWWWLTYIPDESARYAMWFWPNYKSTTNVNPQAQQTRGKHCHTLAAPLQQNCNLKFQPSCCCCHIKTASPPPPSFILLCVSGVMQSFI